MQVLANMVILFRENILIFRNRLNIKKKNLEEKKWKKRTVKEKR